MANASRKISAKEVIADIRAAKSHEALMEKYHLTESQLQALCAKLVKNGLIQESELNGSKFNQETTTGAVRAYDLPAPHAPGPGEPGLERPGIADDIRSGMDDLSLLKKYDLSPSELEKIKEGLSPIEWSPAATRNHHAIDRPSQDVPAGFGQENSRRADPEASAQQNEPPQIPAPV